MRGGLILVDKPSGLGSRPVGHKVARHLGFDKFGHVGTLDPLASGLLIVLLGEGTKLSQFLVGEHKAYQATIHLGLETDSCDIDGAVMQQLDVAPMDQVQVETVLQRFTGPQLQVPPAVSAVKIKGVAAHKLARLGVAPDMAPREITIHSIKLLHYRHPDIAIEVQCSKGTYMRSLARDVGEALGTIATLSQIRRTVSEPYHVMHATELDTILSLERERALQLVIPSEIALKHLPQYAVNAVLDQRLMVGNLPTGAEVAALSAQRPFRRADLVVLVGRSRLAVMEAQVDSVRAYGHPSPLAYVRVLER